MTLPTDCNSLCTESTANQTCCDNRAICTCGTATGHYACICPPGYFGSGLNDDCKRKLIFYTKSMVHVENIHAV